MSASKTPAKRRSAVDEAVSKRREAQKRADEAAVLDNRKPPKVSPPAGRTVQPGWRNRKPIVKGGVVTGRRTPPNTA